MENLFTNAPANETIDIIIDNIRDNQFLPPLKIIPNILLKILLAYTYEVQFYNYLGNIYIQTNSVSMVSVLGPIFSNFYISDLENKIFIALKTFNKPKTCWFKRLCPFRYKKNINNLISRAKLISSPKTIFY